MKFKSLLLSVLFSYIMNAQITEVYDAEWENKYVNGKFIFKKFDPIHGTEIWASDGTAAGTNILFDIVPGTGSSNPNYLTVIDDVVYFQTTNTNQIWRTDGTPDGTYVMVAAGLNDPRDFSKVGDFILFRSGSNNNRKLWKMQTTPNSHQQMSTSSMVDVSRFHQLNSGNVLFNVKISGSNQWEIWRTNGNTMAFVADIDTGNSNQEQLGESILFNGDLYFSGYSTSIGRELWKTDGTISGTVLVADIQNNDAGSTACFNCSNPFNFQVVGNNLFFAAFNGNSGGVELYKSNGNGASKVKEINSDGNSNPQHLTAFNGKLYFLANDEINQKIWQSDGTEAGTFQLTNNPLGETLWGFGNILNKIPVFNNHIIYNKLKADFGYEVWKLDLTSGSNSLVMDYNPGTASFYTFGYFEFNNELYFAGEIQGQVGLKMYKFGQEALSITNVEEVNTIKAFPNPTKDIVTLNLLNKENYSLTVFSALGQQIPLEIKNNQLDFSNLSSGIYVVSIKNNIQNKTTHFKIIKQ